MADYEYTDVNSGENFTDDEMEDRYQETLDEIYGEVDIAGYSMSTGSVLREVDYTAFREGFNNWIDSEIQDGNFREYSDDDDDDDDYCYECDETTVWADEKCSGCARTWGYPKGEGPDDE